MKNELKWINKLVNKDKWVLIDKLYIKTSKKKVYIIKTAAAKTERTVVFAAAVLSIKKGNLT